VFGEAGGGSGGGQEGGTMSVSGGGITTLTMIKLLLFLLLPFLVVEEATAGKMGKRLPEAGGEFLKLLFSLDSAYLYSIFYILFSNKSHKTSDDSSDFQLQLWGE
jgi:hypothetical protein